MPPNSEIEKLERRWRENPKGTVFAPYAEVLRKHGDHELAKEVLRQGLELHPDHIPGNIVLGRCSLDLGEDGPAETAFGHVLDLDAENVIALKALADITERHGRLAEAQSWLARLISVDPSNDEARDQLARVGAAQQAAAAGMTVPAAPPAAESDTTVEIIPPPLPSTVKTREIPAFRRPSEAEAIPEVRDRPETGRGMSGTAEPTPITRAVLAAFNARKEVPPEGRVLGDSEARTLELTPLMPAEPEPIADLEPMELDIAAAAKDLTPGPLADIEVGEEFAPPSFTVAPVGDRPAMEQPDPDATVAGLQAFQPPVIELPDDSPVEPPARRESGPFSYQPEERGAIELRPSLSSEFQAPDAANEMIDLTPSGRSEFQAPDAANDLLDLTPTGRSEFQAPDASNELLDLKPAGRSEFQTPDASNELLDLSPASHSEFQTPDTAHELAGLSGTASSEYQASSGTEPFSQADDAPVMEESVELVLDIAPLAEPAPADNEPSLLADLEALSAMPTEEMSTAALPIELVAEPPAAEAIETMEAAEPVAADTAPDWIFEEETLVVAETVAAEPPVMDELDLPLPDAMDEPVADVSERIAAAYAEAEAEARASAAAAAIDDEVIPDAPEEFEDDLSAVTSGATMVDSGRISEEAPTSDLKLIFPDDAAQPEPHQVRRITQEVQLPAMAEETDEEEPEEILTETMAELYARQGHTADALKVYRALSERQPNDTRLRERIAELETRSPQPTRRLTYVALETGGESVESFFRSLAESRPGGGSVRHGSGQILDDDDGSGAPTRPARDPLSLSAIFGEDPGASAARATAEPVAPGPNGPSGDAFSFDQFFGGAGNGGAGGPRPEGASGEDLDQFQHWLKSLKK